MRFNPLPANPIQVEARATTGLGALAALAAMPVITGAPARSIALDGMWGVAWEPILAELKATLARAGIGSEVVRTTEYLKSPAELRAQFQPYLTENPVFGHLCDLPLASYFETERLAEAVAKAERRARATGAAVIVIGPYALGACQGGLGVYCDLPREEIIRRQLDERLPNLGDDRELSAGARYKAAYYVEWPLLEAYKRSLLQAADSAVAYYADCSDPMEPVTIALPVLRRVVADLASRPFRCTPFFMPGVWGGQRLKQVANLPAEWPNCAWDFEIVAPENSVGVDLDGAVLRIPFHILIWLQARAVMGEQVCRQFGEFFPVRVNYLDTMGGTNLSLQVHPHHTYMRERFREPIGQDESYYIVERKPGAKVYLGLRENATRERLWEAVRRAEEESVPFEVTDYANEWEARVGDLFLIPAGTVHCSGADNLVLEISSTPYWYTFKIYDYLRLDLEGKPRPINSGHAFEVIDFTRTTEWVKRHLIQEPLLIRQEAGGSEYHVGSTGMTFYSVNRLQIESEMADETGGGFLLLTVVAGEGARILAGAAQAQAGEQVLAGEQAQSGEQVLAEIAYLETFVVPAAFGSFRIQAAGGQPCQVVKTYVKR